MDEFWGVTIVLFVILTLFVATVVRATAYYKKYHQVRHPRARMSEAALKSGDIILFIGHTHGFTNSLFTADLFTHSGMVVEDGGALYLSEATLDTVPDPATGEEKRLPESSQLNPLLSRLSGYPGAAFLMALERPLAPDQEDVLRERARVETPYPGMLDLVKALLKLGSGTRARHCMQHVAWLLDEMGLAPEYQTARGERFLDTGLFGSSRAVTTLPGEPLGRGEDANRYTGIVELLHDLD
jgi:hypothetical protein